MVKKYYIEDGLKEGIGLWFGEDQISVFAMLQQINLLYLISDRMYYYVRYPEQATKKYDFSLWLSIIAMLERYRDLDKYRIAKDGLRKRTWLYIRRNIYQLMIPYNIDMYTFTDHLSKARKTSYMREFFQPFNIPFGFKENVKYWLLKLKFFRLFYFITHLKSVKNRTLH